MERYLGIDVHRDSSTICVLNATGKRYMVVEEGAADDNGTVWLALAPAPALSCGMEAKADSIVLSGRGLTPAAIVEIARAGRGRPRRKPSADRRPRLRFPLHQ